MNVYLYIYKYNFKARHGMKVSTVVEPHKICIHITWSSRDTHLCLVHRPVLVYLTASLTVRTYSSLGIVD